MSQETQREDVTKKRVVFQIPGEDAVTIRRDAEYRVTDAEYGGRPVIDLHQPRSDDPIYAFVEIRSPHYESRWGLAALLQLLHCQIAHLLFDFLALDIEAIQ